MKIEKNKVQIVVRQCRNDNEWDPDERIGDIVLVAVLGPEEDAGAVIRKDAEEKLRSLGYAKKTYQELFEDFTSAAVNGDWAAPENCSDETENEPADESWRWTVLQGAAL